MAKFLIFDDKIINILLREERPSGGAAVQTYNWVLGLLESGHEVQIFTNLDNPGELKEECKGLTLLAIYNSKKGIRWFRWLYYRIPFTYKQIKESKADYLYQSIPSWASFIIGIICKQLGTKYILRISNDFLLDDRIHKYYSKIHRCFLKLGLKSAYCILCQNEYQLNIIRKELPNKRTLKLPNPIFIKHKNNVLHEGERQYIAWLGLYQYQKNLKLLYEIASLLTSETFVIAGKESGKLDQETTYYLEMLRQLPNIKFAGFLNRNQVLPFLSKAKFLLNTSRYEGFSNTFLEAMSVGTPIITSDKVNPDSIIDKYKLGLVYQDKRDIQSQYTALTEECYRTLSKNSYEFVLNNNSHKDLTLRLLQYLNIN